MDELTSLSQQMQAVLQTYARAQGYASGFIQRRRQFDGATFVQTLVFGWLANPSASLSMLAQMAAVRGVRISVQGLSARFGQRAASFLRQVLGYAMAKVVASSQPLATSLLNRFNGVYVVDTSVIGLPASLADRWSGYGGNRPDAGAAALKVELGLELSRGQVAGPSLLQGRDQDKRGPFAQSMLPVGSLRITDLGYFALSWFAHLSAHGVYWLSRYRYRTRLYEPCGRAFELHRRLRRCQHAQAWSVYLGVRQQVACRLLAVPVPPAYAAQRRRKLRRAYQKQGRQPSAERLALCSWTLLVTNADSLSIAEALALYRSRWQIELLFKLWKHHGGLATSRSEHPWRILCEIYAKLIGLLIQHWVLVKGLWHQHYKSLTKAAAQVRAFALSLARALDRRSEFKQTLADLITVLENGCRINKRRRKPSTAQLLINPQLISLT